MYLFFDNIFTKFFLIILIINNNANAQNKPKFEKTIKPILSKYCITCHGHKKTKGKLNIETLDHDFLNDTHNETWASILDQINAAEMPPEDEDQIPNKELSQLTGWLTKSLQEASERDWNKSSVYMRRLTKEQYSNTLKDLLLIEENLGDELPDEGLSHDGFTNNGREQIISNVHTEYYLKLATKALNLALPEKPKVAYRYRLKFTDPKKQIKHKMLGNQELYLNKEEFKVETFKSYYPELNIKTYMGAKDLNVDMRGSTDSRFKVKNNYLRLEPGLTRPPKDIEARTQPPNANVKLHLKKYPSSGSFRVRVKVARENVKHDYPYVKPFIGTRRDRGEDFISMPAVKVTGTQDKPQTIDFYGTLENFPVPVYDSNDKNSIMTIGLWNANFTNRAKDKNGTLLVYSIEFESPYVESWPPKSHKRIFHDSKNKANKFIYSREIIKQFLSRAFRRQIEESELQRYHRYWQTLSKDMDFKSSIKETLASILCSPSFIYLIEKEKKGQQISEYELANRLSYFLWNSMPDDRLLKLAAKGQLRNQLRAEAERMLNNKDSIQFVREFTYEWLHLSRLDNVELNVKKYPKFNRYIRNDMKKETILYFTEILYKNLSILNFLKSDFSILNQNLAQYYGIKGVKGSEFRVIKLNNKKRFGGLLGQGSFLVGHSNGDESHPIKRGVWFTSRILNDPPPEPPANVPALEVVKGDFSKMTMKQQLEKHSEHPACMDCHRKIDPWGLAFENFDAGGIRAYKPGKAKSTLIDKTVIEGIDGLSAYLIDTKNEAFAKALISQLLKYGLGRSMSYTDKSEIELMSKKLIAKNYKLKELIHILIESSLFSKK